MFKSKKYGQIVNQLVVPVGFRKAVLNVAHETVLGGHLVVKKTIDKIRSQFF